jgi:hypothetical protein
VIATSVAYDLVFLVHVMSAVAVVVVFVTMRVAAQAVAQGADAAIQGRRLPQRRNWAARLLHVLPITGLIMSLSGGSSVSLAHAWVDVGLLCYVAAAGHLEARTLPLERSVAEGVARHGTAPASQGRQLVRSIDVLLAIVALALVTMIVQY